MVGMMGVGDKQGLNSLLLFKHSTWLFPGRTRVTSSTPLLTKCFRFELVSTSLPRLRAAQQPGALAARWLGGVTWGLRLLEDQISFSTPDWQGLDSVYTHTARTTSIATVWDHLTLQCTMRVDIPLDPEPAPRQPSPAAATPPPPASALNLYELTFGSVCGICAGVFIKKGAKFVAFMLGGTFVLLQVIPILQRPFRNLILLPHSTSDLSPSSESTGLVPGAGLRTCSIGWRTASDALPRSDPFGVGSSTFWLQTSSHGPLSQLV